MGVHVWVAGVSREAKNLDATLMAHTAKRSKKYGSKTSSSIKSSTTQ